MNSDEGDRILGLLQQKINFLEEILTCSKTLADLSLESHGTECNNLLITRERYLETLQKLEPVLQEHLDAIPETELSQAVNEQIGLQNDKAAELVREILRLDQQKAASVFDEMQQVKGKLKAVRRGQKGIVGYQINSGINAAGAFTDSRR